MIMRGKKFVISCVCFLAVGCVSAQQQPYYTQYILNNFILNPALAGIQNYWDIKASYRDQWVGLQGAPRTLYLTVNGPLGKSQYDYETPLTVADTRRKPSEEKQSLTEFTAPPAHSGIGLSFINDKTGPLNRIAAYGSYAYHVPVGHRTTLSMGVSLGVQEVNVDVNAVDFGQANPVDPAVLQSGYLGKLEPDINAGLWLSNTRFFAGLSAQQIVPVPLNNTNNSSTSNGVTLLNGKLIPHTFLTAGYKISAGDNITILPSVMMSYVQPLPIGLDVNAKIQYQDLIWLGFSYRYNVGYAALLGVNISSTINLGYSYDYTTTPLNTVSNGTHEIVIGFLVRKKNKETAQK
jgi:type IX secretion system PorP/SprF family membrane protein